MSTLTVSLIQADLAWHDASRNRDMFAGLIESVPDGTDLIVLPEMFSTGFSMDAPALAEETNGETVIWMDTLAARRNTNICGSLIISENGRFYNRFICTNGKGDRTVYDKRHLFRLADEQNHYAPGTGKTVFEIKGFRICPMICYDLRFPVWSRNTGDYDMLIFVANWPSRRHNAWQTLVRARAIENLSFVAGVNRVGVDGNDIPYAGGSAVIDYLGRDMVDLGDQPGVATVALDLAALREFRQRFAFHEDADRFSLLS